MNMPARGPNYNITYAVLLVLLIAITSALLFLNVANASYSQKLWYFDSLGQLILFVLSNLVFLLLIILDDDFDSKFDGVLHRLFIPLYFFSILDLSMKFHYIFLTNPFDTTGLRGLYKDILIPGHIPQTGFYIEYAGQYNKLFVGPLHTVTWMLVSGINVTRSLDDALKVYESFLKISLYICFLVLLKANFGAKLLTKTKLPFLLYALLGLQSFSSVLTLQTYAWPLLALLLYVLTRIIRGINTTDLLTFILLNIILVNTHSTTSAIFTLFMAILLFTCFIINDVSKRIIRIVILSISVFIVKFLYDAVRYFLAFYDVGTGIIRDLYELFFFERISNPDIQAIALLSEMKIPITDYLVVFCVSYIRDLSLIHI